MNVYFDNASTTKVRDEAIAAMVRVMSVDYGNPSSTHFAGRYAAAVLSGARGKVAAALGADPDEVYFTSGGTESDNWAVLCSAEAAQRQGKHIITSSAEHDAVLSPVKKLSTMGWEVTYLQPDAAGRVPVKDFTEALRSDTILASIMLVNNETGAVNPVNEYSAEIRKRKLKTILHTDAVQGFCKIPFSVQSLGADLISVSAHKIHGPKGAGALYIRRGVKLPQMIYGGSQESGRRAGTEALPAIAGFGEAASHAASEASSTAEEIRKLRDRIIESLKRELPETVFIGEGDSPYIISLSLPGHRSEVLMSALEGEGICVARSAACKKGERSRVLEAMRLSDSVINGALRVSLSRYNTSEEADYFANALVKTSSKIIRNRR